MARPSAAFLLPALLSGLILLLAQIPTSRAADDDIGLRTVDVVDRDYYDDELTEDGENRFLFTSTTSVTVNSTLLRVIGAIIGSLLLALPLYLAYATAISDSSGGSSGYGSYYRRGKRAADDEDLVAIMYALLESFRKHELAELEGCQILIACEAGRYQDKEHPKYKMLPRTVHKILSTAALAHRGEERSRASDYIDKLLDAYTDGSKPGTDCASKYRKICPRA